MNQSQEPEVENLDRRHPRGRFSWVRRLMQGQNRQQPGLVNPNLARDSNVPYNRGYYKTTRAQEQRNRGKAKKKSKRNSHVRDGSSKSLENGSLQEAEVNGANDTEPNYSNEEDNSNTDTEMDSNDVRSGSYSSDQITENSDNISTTPLKSIVSVPSTKSPSVLSDNNHDTQSYNASTAETSIAPSSHLNPAIHRDSLPPPSGDRDSESIVTLASSSRRIRRRSLETNSSTAGIPPASIMERIFTQPTANNSAYATSGYANSAYANSVNPSTDRNSNNEDGNSYRDFDSSSAPEST